MAEVTPNILVVIPLYNHAETVRQVVEKTLQLHKQVLVVDDGSSDAGATVLEGLDVRILRHAENRGKGAALKTALDEAQRLGFSHILTIDADGQHDPADIPLFIAEIEKYPTALLVGKRDFEQASIPGSSRFGRQFSNFWLRVQTGKSLADTQSGFRAYPVKIIQGLRLRETRYSYEIEVLVRAAWAGVELRDIDISVYYPPSDERISHFRGFMDNFRLTLLNTKLTMRSIAPWPHRKLVESGEVEQKISVLQPLRSLRTLLTENLTPGQLAAAGAVGVFLGALPILAAHTIVILLVAGYFRLNKVAAVGASQLCMPPLVPGLCIEVGYFMRNGEFLTELSVQTLGYQALDRLYEWLLGSLLVGPVLAGAVALIIYLMAVSIRRETTSAAVVGDVPSETLKREQAWTSRSIGASWQHQSFYLMIRLGGRHAAYLLLYFVVFYYALLPSVRRKCLPYLEHRFPQAGGWTQFVNRYRMCLELGKVLVDRALVGILGPQRVKVELLGKQELLELLAENKGLILVNAHVGCWQVAMSALGFMKLPVNLLMQRDAGDIDRHYFEHAGLECPYKIIDPHGFLGGALEMVAVLKRGEVLSVMGDRMLGEDRNGVAVDFMGGQVTMPFSAYKLASATGAPIVALLSYKTGPDSYALKLFRTIRVPAELGRGSSVFIPYVQEFAETLEAFCQENPFQFFNFFDMWQTSAAESAAEHEPISNREL